MLTAEIIAAVDAKIESPSQRASKVWALLPQSLSTWDVTCFALEYLAMVHESIPWLMPEIKHLNMLMYRQHYLFPEVVNAIIDAQRKQSSGEHEGNPAGTDASRSDTTGSSD